MDIEIRPLERRDLILMVEEMRDMDRREHDLMVGGDYLSNFEYLMDRSRRARAGYADGELVAIYGVITRTPLTLIGHPWLAATTRVEEPRFRRPFLEHGRQELDWMREGFNSLWNIVMEENTLAIRWLKWMGFEFGDRLMLDGVPFLHFSMEAG